MGKNLWGVRSGVAVVIALLIGSVLSPAGTAAAYDDTGAVTIMLMNPAKQTLPLAGATVTLTTASGDVFGSTVSTRWGRATFSRVPKDTSMIATVVPPGAEGSRGYLTASRSGIAVAGGKHVWVVVVMRVGASISGVVRTDYGYAIVGAPVIIRGRTTGTVRQTVADEEATYRFTELPTDDYVVEFNSRLVPGAPPARYASWGFTGQTGRGSPPIPIRLWNEDGAHTPSQVWSDGVVPEFPGFSAVLGTNAPKNFRASTGRFVGEGYGTWSVEVDGDRLSFWERLAPGTYRVAVVGTDVTTGTEVTYWYAGPGVAASPTEADAAPVLIGAGPEWVNAYLFP